MRTVQSQELVIAAPVIQQVWALLVRIKRPGKSHYPEGIASEYTWRSIIEHFYTLIRGVGISILAEP